MEQILNQMYPGRGRIIQLLSITDTHDSLLSMLRPSDIKSLCTAFNIDGSLNQNNERQYISKNDELKYMKFEREILHNTKELYNFIKSGYKVFMVGKDILRIRKRIRNPTGYYQLPYEEIKRPDYIWILIVPKRDICNNGDSLTVSKIPVIRPLNMEFHSINCFTKMSECKCSIIDEDKIYYKTGRYPGSWYTSSYDVDSNVHILYNPGMRYESHVLVPVSLIYRAEVTMPPIATDLSNYMKDKLNDGIETYYTDIEDLNYNVQIPRNEYTDIESNRSYIETKIIVKYDNVSTLNSYI